jgi:hypothetical protein
LIKIITYPLSSTFQLLFYGVHIVHSFSQLAYRRLQRVHYWYIKVRFLKYDITGFDSTSKCHIDNMQGSLVGYLEYGVVAEGARLRPVK